MSVFIPCNRCEGRARRISITPQRQIFRCPRCLGIQKVETNAFHEKSFIALTHQHKGNRIIEALQTRYNRFEKSHGNVQFAISDGDAIGRRMQMERMRKIGVRRFFVYPHSARPSMINDNWQRWDGTTAQIVVNKYHEEVLRGYGYDKPCIYSGWYLTPVNEFQPRHRNGKINVLYGPIHPRNAPQDQQANRAVFDRLLPLVRSGDVALTIRHVGALQDNNIPRVNGVKYIQGMMDGDYTQMYSADVVIGHQTFAWMAVALGIPTLMMAEDMPTHFRARGLGWTDTPSWGKVCHLFQYPLDILNCSDTLSLMESAMVYNSAVELWKSRMIGEAFCDEVFLDRLEKYL